LCFEERCDASISSKKKNNQGEKEMDSKVLIALAGTLSLCVGLEACPSIPGCSFDNSHCTSLTCQKKILGKTLHLNIKLKKCNTDIFTTITVKETSSGTSFTHTFKGDGTLPIRGLKFGLASANIRIKISHKDSNVILEVFLVLKSVFTKDASYRIVKENIGSLKLEEDCTVNKGSSIWFSNQAWYIKALITASAILVAFIID